MLSIHEDYVIKKLQRRLRELSPHQTEVLAAYNVYPYKLFKKVIAYTMRYINCGQCKESVASKVYCWQGPLL